MNEFERQIRAAISAARNGAKHAEQSLTTPMWQAKSTVASLGGIVPRSGSSSTSQAENYKEGLADQAASGNNMRARVRHRSLCISNSQMRMTAIQTGITTIQTGITTIQTGVTTI